MRTSPLDHTDANSRSSRFNATFWKTVSILAGVQMAIGIFALSIGAFFTYDATRGLIENSIRTHLQDMSQEIERRGFPLSAIPVQDKSLMDLNEALILSLAQRSPDPIILIDPNGNLIRTIQPDNAIFKNSTLSPVVPNISPQVKNALGRDRVVVNLDTGNQGSWGSAPIYSASGVLVGGLLIQPLTNSINQGFAGIQKSLMSALFAVIGLSIITSLLLGGYFTRPLDGQQSV